MTDTTIYDSITYGVIKPENHIKTHSGDFDVATLARYYHENKLDAPQDPFNRQPLPDVDAQRVIAYSKTQKLSVTLIYLGDFSVRTTTAFIVHKHISVGCLISHILTEVEYLCAHNLRSLSRIICYDFILRDDSYMGTSMYDMELEDQIVSGDVTSITIDFLKASGQKMNKIAELLDTFTSTRIYDAEANYMAIAYWCSKYKPQQIPLVTQRYIRRSDRITYNSVLDKYFDANGVEVIMDD